MGRANTPTILSLDSFARILSITPVHFGGAIAETRWSLRSGCSDVWPQFAWQSEDELVGREELAIAINEAENDIRRVLGYAVGPEWVAQEVHDYPRYYRRQSSANGRDIRGLRKTIDTQWGKVISPGRRVVAEVDTGATVTYSDADGDGWKELATITASTTLTNTCEIKMYFAGKSGAREWEIRPTKTKTITSGTLTITADSWLFIDPELWDAYPTADDFTAINIETAANFVTTVDIYREYTDTTQASAAFYWENGSDVISCCAECGGTGCAACTLTMQEGCFVIRDAEAGLVAPLPADWDDTAEEWNTACFSVCRDPDQVKLWYQAGNLSQSYLNGSNCEKLDDYLAQAVAYLAVARLEYQMCSCSNVRNVAEELRRDLTLNKNDTSYIRSTSMDIFTNPFGTRKGEVMAWQRVAKLISNNWGGGTI